MTTYKFKVKPSIIYRNNAKMKNNEKKNIIMNINTRKKRFTLHSIVELYMCICTSTYY